MNPVIIGNATLYLGDCLEAMKAMPDNSVDSIVTDPPYGLSFMGKKWDYDVPSVDIWKECLRVMKPGGHLLAFAGTRTQHRMAVRIEDAGFEIRDMIAWVYGSGFPKSLDVSKAIDKAAGAEREVVGVASRSNAPGNVTNKVNWVRKVEFDITAPATEAVRQWQGWGTALKPALEPITVARKPLVGTVAANVLAHGTGAINVDGCRVGSESVEAGRGGRGDCIGYSGGIKGQNKSGLSLGRWPSNFIHDGSDEVVAGFPHTKSGAKKPHINGSIAKNTVASFSRGLDGKLRNYTADASSGSASRFFYCAKASKSDRDEGCYGLEAKRTTFADGTGLKNNGDGTPRNQQPSNQNHHPTVKPTDLMAYLCRLVTPPGGIVLDPFMGSGSTGKAAMRESFRFIGCEMQEEYMAIAKARIEKAQAQGQLFEPEPVKQVQESLGI